jgi:hypothetical protein
MNEATIGWVMDKDTSKRRLHIYRRDDDAGVGLTVEMPGQPSATVWLDLEGVAALYAYVGQAFVRLLVRTHAGQEGR